MADARLSNSSVTSAAINIGASEVLYNHNNLIEENPIPGLFSADPDSLTGNAQTEMQWMGWVNPTYKVQGVIDEDGTGSTRLTWDLLRDFATNTSSDLYLFDDRFCSSGVKVLISNFSTPRQARYKNSEKYIVSINLVETL